jgi:Holliday junction resolvase-like predicted endonuclease
LLSGAKNAKEELVEGMLDREDYKMLNKNFKDLRG